ncbi:MAG TPA: hypothetical protein ENI85_00290 [Deltaproteobacteria bacterium]|nr:hypothetical protein [Deltaproteobacteria bacterium]
MSSSRHIRETARWSIVPLRSSGVFAVGALLLVGLSGSGGIAHAQKSLPCDPTGEWLEQWQIKEGEAAGEGRLESFSRRRPALEPLATTLGASPAGPETGGPVALAGTAPGTEALGEQRVLVSLVNFTNDPSTPLLRADVDDAVFNLSNPDSVASYVLEASYGKAWLSGSVNDWVSASYADASCLISGESSTQRLIDELDPTIDFSTVDRWIVVIPQNPNCGFAGVSSLGKWTFDSDEGVVNLSRIVINGTLTPSLLTHELGHSLVGLQHSADLECGAVPNGTSCSELKKLDRYDVMGSGTGHFTPSSKYALGWLDGEIVDVTGAGGVFLLEPYETGGTGTKALRIPVPWPNDRYRETRNYYVSYRRPLGLDAAYPELATDGAMLHEDSIFFSDYYDNVTGVSRLIDAKPQATSVSVPQDADSADVLLEIGQTFVDSVHGITIGTLSVSGGMLEVSVTIDQYCGNGVVDTAIGEICDGTDLGSATCASIGFTSGTLGCATSCKRFDTASCGPAQCGPNDSYDAASQLCHASILSTGPVHMSVYRNAPDFTSARASSFATLLTESRGGTNINQSFSGVRTIMHRSLIPFDTSPLPDGVTLVSASLDLTHDVFWDPVVNTHPDLGDQLVLVQTSDPDPFVRDRTDYGAFTPFDSPVEGAPRFDLGDSYVAGGAISFPLNAAGLSWIDDTGTTRLGLRWGYDVDDIEVSVDAVTASIAIVPRDAPSLGPRLNVTYLPLPEPGIGMSLVLGVGVLVGLARRQRP